MLSTFIVACCVLVLCSSGVLSLNIPPALQAVKYVTEINPPPQLSPAQRAAAMLAEMNITEKIDMVHGWDGPYVGNVVPNTRLGIPALNLNDGPQGFRDDAHPGTTTQWPSGLTIAATWDPEAANQWGTAMGVEFLGKGANVQLGPGVNVARVPVNGRNFEYISGEDPYLGSVMLPAAVQGIQSQGIIANMKHYINNNQETNRGNVSADVDERTRMEIYATPFGAAAQAGVLSVMCSYNRINLIWSCENNVTLLDELKGVYNFSGWVMSDWGATHSTVASALASLDQEMPSDDFFGDSLLQAIQDGEVPESNLDDKVLRILTAMYAAGVFDRPNNGNIANNVTSTEHNTLARSLAGQGAVLLQNFGTLPLNPATVGKIAVIGAAAYDSVITGGGGSGSVVPYYQVSALEGIAVALNGHFTPAPPRAPNCTFDPGYDYYQPTGDTSGPGHSAQDCCLGCAALSWCMAFTFVPSGNICYYKPNSDGRQVNSALTSGNCTTPNPGPPLPSNLAYNDGSDLSEAAAVAANADVAIVVIATTSSEGSDRPNLNFGDQDALVSAVAEAQPNTVVVMINPGAVLTSWSNQVDAVLAMFMPGQEEGNAIADVLFGLVEPGGRLPVTMPNIENEVGFTPEQYPGLPTNNPLNAEYSEMMEVGYRWYQSNNVAPKFAFGHGLSYTTFSYSDLSIDGMVISFTLTNTGSRAGVDVPQLYLTFPESAGEPPKQLKGFQKTPLAAGASAKVTFNLVDRDVSIWDINNHAFTMFPGRFGVTVGASSQDDRLYGTLVVP